MLSPSPCTSINLQCLQVSGALTITVCRLCLESVTGFDSGVSPKGAIHLVLSANFHDSLDPRLTHAYAANSSSSGLIELDSARESKPLREKKLSRATSDAGGVWDPVGEHVENSASEGSSVSTLMDSAEDGIDVIEDEWGQVGSGTGARPVIGSVGLSLTVSTTRAVSRSTVRSRPQTAEDGLDDFQMQCRGVAEHNVMVESVLAASPADAAGIRKGDIIVAVDDTVVGDLSLFAVESLLFGLANSRVALTIARPDNTTHLAQQAQPPRREFTVILLRDADREIGKHDKVDIHRAMQQSAAQAWSHASFSVIHEDRRLPALTLPELMLAFRDGRFTRHSLLLAPEAGIQTWTQVSQLPDILLLLEFGGTAR